MKSLKIALSVLTLFIGSEVFAADFSCNGTEPFWGIKVQGETLTYSTPENQDGREMKIRSIRDAAGVPEWTATVVKTGCALKRRSTLTLLRGKCSDGMSDKVYSHHAIYDVDGGVLYGCCDLK